MAAGKTNILILLPCLLACARWTVAAFDIESEFKLLKTENIEMKQLIASTSQQIKAMQAKINDLESIVNALNDNIKEQSETEKSEASNNVAQAAIYRTCHETKLADPSLPSGIYWIDPDGIGAGDDPISVYCDTATGTTSILHDSEEPMDVENCADPGCYSRPVNYQATTRQIKALVSLSNQCQQSIKYECNYAPLEMNGVTYSWWNDNDGNPQYFWAGSNATVHTCQCGIDHNCIDPMTTCNCDAGLPLMQIDDGVITKKDLLPISRLNFGRTPLATSSGVHTLGRLQCSGQIVVQGKPKSCADLWRMGHTVSGFYSVAGSKSIDQVYCDFSKLPSDAGFQTWIGQIDAKSSSVHFDVRRSTNFYTVSVPIPYEVTNLNEGAAMNLQSGIFTAPCAGFYFFSFSGAAGSGLSDFWTHIELVVNNNFAGFAHADLDSGGTNNYYYESFAYTSTHHLQAGDTVWVRFRGTNEIYLYGSTFHFTGFLIKEDLVIA